MAGFSSALKLTDLDDFITPSQECIKPVTTAPVKPPASARGVIRCDEDAAATTNPSSSSSAPPTQKATISLSDCLACSGCVTSAEVVLVEQQSHLQFRAALADPEQEVVVSMCPQAVLSIAHKHKLPPPECALRLAGYFRELGALATWDTNLARSVVLLEVAKEFSEKFSNDPASLPLICSACPGWICYAEKTQTQQVLDHVSRVRSPQQVMGALVKGLWAPAVGRDPRKVFHVTVMPCFDKKLEASRSQFTDELTQTKDVDCVITAMEVDQMLAEEARDLSSVAPAALSELLSSGELTSHEGSSAGGYADFILNYMASSVYNIDPPTVQWRTLRNADMQEASLTVGGEEVVRVCRAYGFRNLQNVVQKVKRSKSTYHYIEIMACPGGCLNGGAQIRPDTGQTSKELLALLQEQYSALPTVAPQQDEGALKALQELVLTQPNFTKTDYKIVEKNVTALGIKW